MKTNVIMLKPSAFESGIYRFDGNSLIADVQEQSLTVGTYITNITFFEQKGILTMNLSDGRSLSIDNFLTVANVEVEALAKRGVNGVNGGKGLDGLNGKDGKNGDRGMIGQRGSGGAMGFIGETGPKGYYGETGPQGETGVDGVAGVAGEKGDTGLMGAIGESGNDGKSNIVFTRDSPDPSMYVGVTNPLWIGI